MSRGKCVFFFDFDNTITKFDILDDMLERFSKDDNWMALEEKWKRGEIGSLECLDAQIRGIKITRGRLDSYLSGIKLDPSFKKILGLCDRNNTRKVILSDNFDYILKGILKNNGISGVDVYCNSLKLLKESLIPRFPYSGRCRKRCAHCKTGNLKANIGRNTRSIYVGDGLSDLCPSKRTDLVFAKSSLRERLSSEKVPFVPFDDLSDVYKYLKRSESWPKNRRPS
ncbi:MAG: MtnX-like HAD-IB family phosphatase [Candidatus Omnitrophica bacterium]|nr:MtnX-like HAD-IB family phosphatase [Candidatus Omnitrophota bacterium]